MILLDSCSPINARISTNLDQADDVMLRRLYSSLRITSKVSEALNHDRPVVCLESTIITHGMAFPDNLRMAKQVERVIEKHGAVPATIAVLRGRPCIGLESAELEELARTGTSALKLSRRDLAFAVAEGATGGTTVSATMILAKKAGIKVFVTGGIGGVHRNAETTMDISNDLNELSRNDVAVVCAGPKAILDIPRTLEYLETMGVSVVTLGQDNLPAFYSRDSGIKSPQSASSTAQIARRIQTNHDLALESGSLVCVPVPEEHSLDLTEMSSIIRAAIFDADAKGIVGKDTTPFLLAAVSKATKGRSLQANIALVLENARVGAEIARHLASSSIPSYGINPEVEQPSRSTFDLPEVLVIGGVAIDTTCVIKGKLDTVLHTSNPGKINTSIGGVAGNIARAIGEKAKLLSVIGDQSIGSIFEEYGVLTEFIRIPGSTASYTCVQADGKLVVAVADMDIFDTKEARALSTEGIYKAVIFDANINVNFRKLSKLSTNIVCFEPTSVKKSTIVLDDPWDLFNMTTPNIHELDAMYEGARIRGIFESDTWWQRVNEYNINSDFRNKVEILLRDKRLSGLNLSTDGTIQKAIHLLPIFHNIYLTLGAHGVLSFHESRQSMSTPHLIHDTMTIAFHPGEKAASMISDTGCGDTFTGILVSTLLMKSIEKAVSLAQQRARETLATRESVRRNPLRPSIKNGQ